MHRQVLIAALALAPVARAEPPREAAEAPAWKVRAAVVGTVARDTPATLEIVVETRAGFHLNDDYPIHFDVQPAPGVAFPRARIDRKDVGLTPCAAGGHACRARVPVAFTPSVTSSRAGGTLAFSACDAERCLIEKVAISAPVAAR